MSIISQHDPNYAWTVEELNTAVQHLLRSNMGEKLWLQGELGRISTSRGGSGHFYSTLKDNRKNAVSIAFFNGAATVSRLQLKEGDVVMVYGHVDLFVAGGSYQFIVEHLQPVNQQGQLMQRYLATRAKLEAEGLFAAQHKKPLPALPRCIGVITSLRQGVAAVNDFLATIYRRLPNAHVRLVNARMQGAGTAEDVAKAINFLNATNACDVIVVTRGGGSMEDLWDFNDENLARTVFASAIPIVSAIGHQIDSTMIDYVADRSVITPTDAAVAVSETAVQLRERLEYLKGRLTAALQRRALTLRNRLLRAASCPYLQRPQDLYLQQMQHLDLLRNRLLTVLPQRAARAQDRLKGLQQRLPDVVIHRLELRKAQLANLLRPLAALDPRGVLKRGYSILLDEQNRAVRTPDDVSPGQRLSALLAEGNISIIVDNSAK